MHYTVRHFDLPLLEFEADMDSAETNLRIVKVYDENRAFLPLNLTVSEDGLGRWLRHRTIPKNRAYVDALLSKVGLSLNRPLGIITVCKGLSLNDCFWVDAEGSGDTFAKVNLYDNRFSQVLAAIAFTGYGSGVAGVLPGVLDQRNAAEMLAADEREDLSVQRRNGRLQQHRI